MNLKVICQRCERRGKVDTKTYANWRRYTPDEFCGNFAEMMGEETWDIWVCPICLPSFVDKKTSETTCEQMSKQLFPKEQQK